MLLLRLSWRNLWRNPKRSLLTAAAVASGFAFLIVLIGLMEGTAEQMLRNGTGLLTGDIQVHHEAYLPERSLFDTLDEDQPIDLEALLEALTAVPEVEAAAPRLYGFGLLSTGEDSSGAQLMGIDPEREPVLSSFLEGLESGTLLAGTPAHSLILGDALAEELGASLGSEVAVVTQAADGSLGNDLFQVAGILRTGITYLDRSIAVFHLSDLQVLLALEVDSSHEIALKIRDAMEADRISDRLEESELLPLKTRAVSWGELSPQLRDYVGLAKGMNGFVIGIIALFCASGVLNTMMMAVFERTREIGLITCLGMSPAVIVGTILLESFFLGLMGLALGFGAGVWAMSYLMVTGLDLSRWTGELTMLGSRMDPVLRATWAWESVGWSALGLLAATLIAALIPARRAAFMRPFEAMTAPVEG